MRKENTKEPLSYPVLIATVFLCALALFCIFIMFSLKSTKLLIDLIGLLVLIVLMNIASRLKINKEKVKLWSIICILMIIISIPLMINRVIFSFVLSVPALIIAKKLMKKNSKPTTVKMAYFGSLIVFLLGIAMSVVSVIMNLVSSGL